MIVCLLITILHNFLVISMLDIPMLDMRLTQAKFCLSSKRGRLLTYLVTTMILMKHKISDLVVALKVCNIY